MPAVWQNMKSKVFAAWLACFAVQFVPASAMEGDPYAAETAEQHNARMAWWREAKFGMFIHWGVYAVPAGNYDGKAIGGYGEWIMEQAKIPVERYKAYAKDFNPVKYDPAAWAALAKEAGMRYLVITSKHHDGFALFPSEATTWDVADSTPWKNDLIGPLAEATRSQGLKFGLYYSQAQDWTHPGGAKAGISDGEGWDAAHKGSFDAYIDQIAVPQVREILSRYQPDVLWWDTPYLMNSQRAAKLAALLPGKPGIIHNNRLGGGYKGDTETPEQYIPPQGYPGRDWETCMTMNNTWGFKGDDHNWKSATELIRNLVDITSKGGNYLLNVGPTADGEIPAESIRLLKEVGAWMKVNGEAIYGSQAGPFRKLPWGRCTRKVAGEETLLYLHVFDWPADGKLTVPGLSNEVKSAELLATGGKLEISPSDDGPVIQLPANAPDAISSTVRLKIGGQPQVTTVPIQAGQDGVIRLLAEDATFSGQLQTEHHGKYLNIGYWTNPQDTVSWDFKAPRDGTFVVKIEAATPSGGSVLQIDGVGKLAYSVPATANFQDYKTTKVGEVNLSKNDRLTLTLKPVADGWRPINVRKVELVPQP
jgi:alpha-L-fucosidase